FHLMTHAFFKAVLFLGAGSVIIAMHHEQDMRKMGGLRKYMPITYLAVLVGGLANVGFPGFGGFFSKEAIIEAVHLADRPGATFAYWAVTLGVFVTALYTFRLLFLTFYGQERFRQGAHGGHGEHGHHGVHGPHESPWVVTLPLMLLAVPSIGAGWLIGPILFGDYFGPAILISPEHGAMARMAEEFHGVLGMMAHAVFTLPFWLMAAGIATAWYLYIARPELPERIKERAGLLYTILERKYGFDELNDWFFAGGTRKLGTGLWKVGDVRVIDGFFVNGSARMVGWFSTVIRRLQSGYIYHYAFTMIIGVFVLLTLRNFLGRWLG
ncbi:MAG: NADH-quinone oxidoreductase subunit L, partial [Azospira oryzae]